MITFMLKICYDNNYDNCYAYFKDITEIHFGYVCPGKQRIKIIDWGNS